MIISAILINSSMFEFAQRRQTEASRAHHPCDVAAVPRFFCVSPQIQINRGTRRGFFDPVPRAGCSIACRQEEKIPMRVIHQHETGLPEQGYQHDPTARI
jgi:hypothetical protein